jgi:predicted outer membrane repeat protein
MIRKKQFNIIAIIIIYLYIYWGPSLKATEVSGDVSGIWVPDDYQVIGDLRVPPGLSLAIMPGSRIEFQGYYQFVVDSLATLRAVGLESDSIVFTSNSPSVGWNGVRFYWADSSCEIAYCHFEWGRGARHSQFPTEVRCSGGAINVRRGSLSVRNSHFRRNRASDGFGGGIYAYRSALLVSGCVIDSNSCGSGGSAIYATNSDVVIENSLIFNDSTYYPLGGEHGGGAIGCEYSNVEIIGNTITDNFCAQGGGGLLMSYSRSYIAFNYISNNRSYDYGAGLAVGSGSFVINNIISYNSVFYPFVGSGGGITCGDSVTLKNNTIAFNYSANHGGGIASGTVATDTFENNIIWGNVANTDSQIYFASDRPVCIYNDIQGGLLGEGNINADPLFAGPDDFHLTWANFPLDDSTKSPCIDTGDPLSPPDSDGTRADMGALFFDRRDQGIFDDFKPLPEKVILIQNYPNPFNAQTTIKYSLQSGSNVLIDIFDIAGRKVETLLSGYQEAGEHQVVWNAGDRPSGVYFYRIKAGSTSKTEKCILLK